MTIQLGLDLIKLGSIWLSFYEERQKIFVSFSSSYKYLYMYTFMVCFVD